MSLQELNTVCLVRRIRLRRERRAILLATIATVAASCYVIVAAFGGL